MIELPHNPFVLWCKQRIQKNRNAIIVINGSTGSGKTYSAIGLCKMISKELGTPFSVKDNLDFSFKGLIKKMELPKNQEPGTCFVFEEVGATGGGASSREWQSKENKLFFSWLQTCRHQNQIIIMTCPCFDNLELGARKLVHWQINTSGIDYINKVAFLKPYKIQVNSRTGKFYFKYMRITYKGRKTKLQRLNIAYMGDEMANDYEKMKEKFSKKLRSKIFDDPNDVPDDKVLIIKKMLEEGKKQTEIAKTLGVTRKTIYRAIKKAL